MRSPRAKARRFTIPRGVLLGLYGAGAVIVGIAVAFFIWYFQQLRPVDSGDQSYLSITIEPASALGDIADTLEEEGVIKNSTALLLYVRLHGLQGSLQAGGYKLSPSETTPEIVGHLVDGRTETLDVTFYPGATLTNITGVSDDRRQDVVASLQQAGFSDSEIAAGLAADYSDYSDTLFQGRPEGADLEGYVYGDTYSLASGATVEDALRASFDEFWSVIEDNNLAWAFAGQGLNLYEGITLASIVQREAIGGDEAQIASVFYNRLAIDMPLGSDVTYQYIADKTGVARDPTLDSEYNTRVYAGLPPGPIASPGIAALKGVANPANTDYLYFLSGDDDVTYFAKTLDEHESNKILHCQEKCSIL